MSSDDRGSHNDRVLDALVSNTEAMTHLNASVSSLTQDYAEGRKAAREASATVAAKLDNLDRSVAELKLSEEKAESARQAELKRIYDLLGEERRDRREAVSEGRDGERGAREQQSEVLRRLVQEEMHDRRGQRDQNKDILVSATKAMWDKGGQWIVLSVAFLIMGAVMKLTGVTLADILGIAGK